MSSPPRFILVGCGLMGKRHIRGLAEARRHGLCSARLVGVIDKVPERASEAAELAEKLLGERPAVFTSLEDAMKGAELEAADICTEPASHHLVAEPLLEAGVSCLVEKPLSITVRGCRRILDASVRGGAVLAVAENYRRDPVNRLAKAVIDGGELGRWIGALHIIAGGGDAVLLSAWRHKLAGGILIDLCCHYMDIYNYFFGAPEKVSGFAALLRKVRYAREAGGLAVRKTPVEAEAEDSLDATLHYRDEIVAKFIANLAVTGEGVWHRLVFLEGGSIEIPMERTGEPLKISKPLDQDYLELMPHTTFLGQKPGEPYKVSPTAAEEIYDRETRILFPGILNGYRMDFWEADRKLIALELADFFHCVEEGGVPETGGREGMLSVAMVIAALESSYAGKSVRLEDVLDLKIEGYQERVNREIGLISDK
ncbi:Putative oxidoreductase YteT [Candidatus Calditenuaceae archaeon HR02]|nr:Putative oxidoreductase YteT [Candidatus Calditenuaceae archaeon HR02]